ncbi:MAG: cytochrome C oxidase subunit IV family protein [Bacteroidota bacterium]
MSKEKHITPYYVHIIVLGALLVLTATTVLITRVELGALNTTAAMLIASIKGVIVLLYFMHLKFDQKIYGIMVGLVMAVFIAVIVITFFDYLFR